MPLANLAWDHDSGRIYLVSTTQEPDGSAETDIALLASDDDGATWFDPSNPGSSTPLRVNDDPPTEVRSQFFPHVAVDQATGHVAVAWHDARNDSSNRETELFLGLSADSGETFTNLSASDGFFSRASGTDTETSHGDYLGVDFQAGRVYAAWADNSNRTMDNPDPACPADPSVPCMDIYVPEPGSAMQLVAGLTSLLCLAGAAPRFDRRRSRRAPRHGRGRPS